MLSMREKMAFAKLIVGADEDALERAIKDAYPVEESNYYYKVQYFRELFRELFDLDWREVRPYF